MFYLLINVSPTVYLIVLTLEYRHGSENLKHKRLIGHSIFAKELGILHHLKFLKYKFRDTIEISLYS